MGKKHKKKQPAKPPVKTAPPAFQLSWPAILLAVVALGISIYLLQLHIQIAESRMGTDGCSALFGVSCEDALASDLAVQYGVPLGGWGIIYYATLLALLLLGHFLRGIRVPIAVAALFLSVVAAVVSVVLLWVMLSGRTGFCPFCAIIHGINFALLFMLFRRARLRDVVAPVTWFEAATPSQKRATSVTLAASLLVAIVAHQAVFRISERAIGAETNPAIASAPLGQQSGGGRSVSDEISEPEEGSAPARIEVFSDFQCPSCRSYAPVLADFKRYYGDNLELVFRHFPLDHACNPIMDRPMHLWACEAAYAVEAAGRQGKFWEYHDELFDSDISRAGTDIFPAIARSLGLDVQKFESDRRSFDIRAKVRADIERGMRFEIHSTPTVILNGRLLPERDASYVRPLIEDLIEKRSG